MNAGKLLIATPSIIGDYNFQRSVILLVDEKTTGTVGFILNKPLEYTLDEVIDGVNIKFPLYYGGPVEQDSLFFIHRTANLIPNSLLIYDDVYWSGDFETVIELLISKELKEDKIRFFLGYSGWSEDQLETELKSKSWIIANSVIEKEWIKKHSKNLWKNHMKAMGGEFLIWSNTPENPSWN
jgi:putative transcriptional regulator